MLLCYYSQLVMAWSVANGAGDPCSFWPGSMYFSEYCYKLSDATATWDEAQLMCESQTETSSLALLPTLTHLNFIINATMTEGGTEWWIAGTLVTSVSSQLSWPHVKLTPPTNNLVICLYPGQCLEPKRFVCEMYVRDPCQIYLPGSEFYKGICYRLNRTKDFWNNSIMTCEVAGAFLAEFYDNDTYYHFENSAKTNWSSVSNMIIFLGATDNLIEGDFRWMSTNLPVESGWWYPGQPSNMYGHENHLCLWMKTINSTETGLNDVNGDVQLGMSLCQKNIFVSSYVIVLPQQYTSPKLRVTSGEWKDTVYLYYFQLLTTGEVTEIQSSVTFQHSWEFRVNSKTAITSPGISQGVVVLRSTHDVTLVLHYEYNGHADSTLVFPFTVSHTSYFLLSPDGPVNQVFITALNNGTRVALKLSETLTQKGILVTGFPIEGRRYIHVTLGQYQTAYIHVNGDVSGTFVHADRPIAVFVNTESQSQICPKSINKLQMALPVESMTSQHVTIPSNSESTSCDVYKLLALYDNTSVRVYESNQLVFSYNLTKAGDVIEARLPNDKFHLLQSAVNHPFYVSKVAPATTSLIPVGLWSQHFDFEIMAEQETIYIIKKGTSKIFELISTQNKLSTIEMTCSVIIEKQLYGCNVTLKRGIHHLRSEYNDVMAAYSLTQFGNDAVTCRTVGSNNSYVLKNGLSYPSEAFLRAPVNATFQAPLTTLTIYTSLFGPDETQAYLNNITFNGEAANSIYEKCYFNNLSSLTVSTTTQNTISTTSFRLNISSIPNTPDFTRCPSIRALIISITESLNTQMDSSLLNGEVDRFLMNLTDLVTGELKSLCETLYSTLLKISWPTSPAATLPWLHFVDVDLRLRKKDLSAYKRTLVSIWDYRLSSHVIGVSGVTFMVIWIIIIAIPDISRIVIYIFRRFKITNDLTKSDQSRTEGE